MSTIEKSSPQFYAAADLEALMDGKCGSGESPDAAYDSWIKLYSQIEMEAQNAFDIEVVIFDEYFKMVEERTWERKYDVPKFWAGIHDDEDIVSGYTGDTPDEAYGEYVENDAEDEADKNEVDTIDVTIYACISPKESGYQAEEVNQKWEYCLGDLVETRTWGRNE